MLEKKSAHTQCLLECFMNDAKKILDN